MEDNAISRANNRYNITDPDSRKGVKVYLSGIDDGDYEVRRLPLSAVRKAHPEIHWLARFELRKKKANPKEEYSIDIEVSDEYAAAYERSQYIILDEDAETPKPLHPPKKGGVSIKRKQLDPSVGMTK